MHKLLIFLTSLFFTNAYATEPQNLDILKKEVISYHDSGQYMKDLTSVSDKAIAYLNQRIKMPHQQPLAIVLDIDETSLSNYDDMRKFDFGGITKEVDDNEGEGHDPAIPSTLHLYQFAMNHHIAVFFVTGRSQIYKINTIHNLQRVGFKTWQGLFMAPDNYHEKSYSVFKTKARQTIARMGYDIVLNMGDQHSDLVGGFADRTYKLPDPYYLVL